MLTEQAFRYYGCKLFWAFLVNPHTLNCGQKHTKSQYCDFKNGNVCTIYKGPRTANSQQQVGSS